MRIFPSQRNMTWVHGKCRELSTVIKGDILCILLCLFTDTISWGLDEMSVVGFIQSRTRMEYKIIIFSNIFLFLLAGLRGWNKHFSSTSPFPLQAVPIWKSALRLCASYLANTANCSKMGNWVELKTRKLEKCVLIWLCDVTVSNKRKRKSLNDHFSPG